MLIKRFEKAKKVLRLILINKKKCFQNIYRGYGMSVSSILNLLHKLNKIILCEPPVITILSYSTSSINSVMNLHKFNILFITYLK
jgi:hypothetical protein